MTHHHTRRTHREELREPEPVNEPHYRCYLHSGGYCLEELILPFERIVQPVMVSLWWHALARGERRGAELWRV